MPFSTLFLPEARDQLESVLERVFLEPETARLGVSSPGGFKRRRIDGQMLLLPLRSDLGAITRALGCIAIDDIGGRKPRRLEITSTEQRIIPRGRPFITRPSPAPHEDLATGTTADVIEFRVPHEPVG